MTSMFSQGHKGTGKLEHVPSFCVEMHEATEMFMMVEYVRKMSAKKSYMLNMDRLNICFFFFFGGGGRINS